MRSFVEFVGFEFVGPENVASPNGAAQEVVGKAALVISLAPQRPSRYTENIVTAKHAAFNATEDAVIVKFQAEARSSVWKNT